MKGKLFQPLRKKSVSEKLFKPRQKPWNEPPKLPSIYFWKSSIPEKHFKDQSRVFKILPEAKRTKKPKQFQQKTQNYTENIADSNQNSPSIRVSIINSKQESSDDELDRERKNSQFLLMENEVKHDKKEKNHAFTERSASNAGLKTVESLELGIRNPGIKGEGESVNRLLNRRASLPKLFEEKDEDIESKMRFLGSRVAKNVQGLKLKTVSPRINYIVMGKSNKRGLVN